MREFLLKQGVPQKLLDEVEAFRNYYKLEDEYIDRIPQPRYKYYGGQVWSKLIAGILAGYNVLLSGPKATGKNVLADNLASLFYRPMWNMSMNINSDAASLLGSDTFVNNEVVLRKGPVYMAAEVGGFAVFDEINMAKNESLAVIYSALDHRRIIDVPGYDKIRLHEASRILYRAFRTGYEFSKYGYCYDCRLPCIRYNVRDDSYVPSWNRGNHDSGG